MNKMSPIVKDRLILAGWIAGLLVAVSLAWSLSFPYRSALLLRSVNKALESAGDPRIISSPLPGGTRHTLMGLWYRLFESDSSFFVFVIMNEGILVPCGVEITKEGKAVGIVPLGNHARQIMGRIPKGVIQVYLRRIESASAGSAASTGSAVKEAR